MNKQIALPHHELARIAPNYEAMRTAIERCEKVDEISRISNLAVAAQAYYRQSLDVENEMQCSRVRARSERRLGEVLKRMAETGERAGKGDRSANVAPRDISTLDELGISRDRASRAMQLAEVPEQQFEAALGEPVVAEPRRILREQKPVPTLLVPINQTLSLWGKVRELGTEIESGAVPSLAHWRENLQQFQLDHLRRYIPQIISYLSAIQRELNADEPAIKSG